MRSPRLSPGFVVAATLLMGARCGADPKPAHTASYAHVYAFPDCAPWDGSAVSIYFTNTTYDTTTQEISAPFLHLAIWRDAAREPETRIEWPKEESVGGAYLCAAAQQCTPAASGVVSVDGLIGDSLMAGVYDVRFGDSTRLKGEFKARWVDRRMMCG
jgi:hypothetical protein